MPLGHIGLDGHIVIYIDTKAYMIEYIYGFRP